MVSPLLFQIPIFLLLVVGAYRDYKTRIISNKIILGISLFSIPLILQNTNFLIPILLCLLFLGLFYFTNSIGGADTKVLIPLLLSMGTNSIFIFFFLFSISNIFLIFKFRNGIPLYISILFGYFGVVILSLLPFLIQAYYDYLI